MKFEKPQIKSEKEIVWEQKRKEIDEITDRIGHRIDEGIKETVTAFNVIGLPTYDSCEGHAEWGLPVPYVEVRASGEPEERFIGQNKVFERVARKYNITVDEIKRAKIPDAYWEAAREFSQNGETREYKKWDKENEELLKKAKDLLEDFYKDRKVEENIKLQVEKEAVGFRIHNGGDDYNPIIEGGQKFTEEEKKERAEKVKKYKSEIEAFTKFLENKYF